VQPDGVRVPDAVKLGVEFAGVADLLQVRPLALDVVEQGLDLGLILGVRAGELLGDGGSGHELAGGDRAHLRAVIADGQQQRDVPAAGQVVHGVAVAAGDCLPQRRGGHLVGQLQPVLGSNAGRNATSTWVGVCSALVSVASHLRDTTSKMAIEARRAQLQ
jgi:hypothetical protein